MAAKCSPPVTPRSPFLVLDPPEYLTFKVPEAFDKRTIATLTLTNTSQRRVGFKMKSTAPDYYGADPATGIVEPNSKFTISVCLWEQPGIKLSQLEWKKHKFGISYLVVGAECNGKEIDSIVKAYPKQVKSAVLKCVLCNEDDHSGIGRSRMSSLSNNSPLTENLKFDSIKPTQERTSILEAALTSAEEEVDLLQEALALKESVISELEKKVKELTKEVNSLETTNKKLNELHEIELVKLQEDNEKAINELKESHEEEIERLIREKESAHLFKEEMQQAFQKERNEWVEERDQLIRENENARLFVEEMKRVQNGSHGLTSNDISFWEASYKDVTIGNEIGRGAYAMVYEGRYMEQKVAIKELHQVIQSEHHNQLLCREVSLLARVRHPNLVLFIAVAFDHPKGSPLIITELLTMSLRDAYQRSLLSNQDYIHIMYDIASALHYLHSRKDPILHRDVSSANVLLQQMSGMWRGKMSDFGAANLAKMSVTAVPGAMIYCAPETPRESVIVDDDDEVREQTTKVDVFSYGVLLCEVFTETPQLPTKQLFQLMLKSVEKRFPKMHNLIAECIKRTPSDRPTMEYILKHFRTTFKKLFE